MFIIFDPEVRLFRRPKLLYDHRGDPLWHYTPVLTNAEVTVILLREPIKEDGEKHLIIGYADGEVKVWTRARGSD